MTGRGYQPVTASVLPTGNRRQADAGRDRDHPLCGE